MVAEKKLEAKIRAAREDALSAFRAERYSDACACYLDLIRFEPDEGEWPRRLADCYWRMGNSEKRLEAAILASNKYSEAGLLLKAIAMCKIALSIDPIHTDTQRRLAELHARRPLARQEVSATARRVPHPLAREKQQLGRIALKAPVEKPRITRRAQKERARYAAEQALKEIRARRAIAEEARGALHGASGSSSKQEVDDVLSSGPTTPVVSPSHAREAPPPEIDPRARTLRAALSARVEPSLIPLESIALSERVPGTSRESAPPSRGNIYSLTLGSVPSAELRTARLPDLAPVEAPEPSKSVAVVQQEARAAEDVPTIPPPSDGPSFAEAAFQNTPLLSQLSPVTLHQLIQNVDLVELEKEETLFREGDLADAMYVVVEGAVLALANANAGESIELARLTEGDFFGEIGLLSDQPRQASVVAQENTRLLRFDRETVSSLINENDEFLGVLLQFIHDRLVEDLMLTSPLFTPLPDVDRRELSELFEFFEIEPDTLLVDEGQHPIGMYVLLSGEALRARAGADGVLHRLGPGSVFGEQALLENRVSNEQVRTKTKCFALCLPSDCFREVILTHPTVLSYVTSLKEEQRALTPEAQELGDHVSLF